MLSLIQESNIFVQCYFQLYEYDLSMLDFHLFKLLKILLKIHLEQ